MIRRRALTTVALTAAALTAAVPAWAFFTAQDNTDLKASAAALAQGATPGVSVSGRDVVVSWSSSAVGVSTSDAYTVSRFDSASSTTAIVPSSACSGTLTALTCREAGLPTGTWYYRVTPKKVNWVGPTSAASAGATVNAAALSLSPATVTADGGSVSATVSSYYNGEIVRFCLDTAACTTPLTTSTVPAEGGALTSSLSIPVGLSLGSHTIFAVGPRSTTSAPITVTVGAAAKLAFTTQPGNATAGAALSPQPVVRITDAFDNATTSGAIVSLAVSGGANATGCTATAVNGTATFSGCTISPAGTYFLTATASGLTSATSNSFTVTPAAAALAITAASPGGGSIKYKFSGTASPGSSVTVRVCAAPSGTACASNSVVTAAVTVTAQGTFATGDTTGTGGGNLNTGTRYVAVAVVGTTTSAGFAFTAV